MKHARAMTTSILVPLLAGGPAFAPEPGSSLTKHFETGLEIGIASFRAAVDGVDFPTPVLTLDAEWTRALSVTDTYVASSGGRPTELERSFDEVGCAIEFEVTVDEAGNTAEGSGSGASSLAGRIVRFVWSEEDEAYEGSYADDGERAAFPDLREDMDLRAFLPEGEVAEGDEWAIEPVLFLETTAPGGKVPLEIELRVPQGDPRLALVGIDPLTVLDFADWSGEDPSGSVTATFEGLRTAEDRELAVIALEVDLASRRDVADVLSARWGSEPPLGARLQAAELELELAGAGELLWEVAAGRLFAYHFEADVRVLLGEEFSATVEGADVSVASELELEGTFHCDVTTE